jgi:hypothetical protein
VNALSTIATISADQIGTNLAIWYDVTTPGLGAELAPLGAHVLRWPGGSTADVYHWQNQTECNSSDSGGSAGAAYSPNSTFANFMKDVVQPGGYDVAVTAAYGTNVACNGGGVPSEAAAWVAYVKSNGWNSHVRYWTVGNEVFGGWETDLHNPANDAGTYAAAMSGSNGYYALMKAADPTIQVGVVVDVSGQFPNWDSTVLASAPYDFVELHYYAQNPGSESDSWLLNSSAADYDSQIAKVRADLAAAGHPNTPIMVGEDNSVSYNPGKQTVSIVNALFMGQNLVEGIKNNLMVTTVWFGDGGTQNCGNNNSSSLYGWQNWGSYDLVFGNTMYAYNGCSGNTIVPEGSLSPSGQAFALVSQFATPGDALLSLSVGSGLPGVVGYAATQGSGYALLLFNLNQSASSTVTVKIANATQGTYQGSTISYGRAQYDASQNNVWTGPVNASLGTVSVSGTSVTLPPYSITLLKLQ